MILTFWVDSRSVRRPDEPKIADGDPDQTRRDDRHDYLGEQYRLRDIEWSAQPEPLEMPALCQRSFFLANRTLTRLERTNTSRDTRVDRLDVYIKGALSAGGWNDD